MNSSEINTDRLVLLIHVACWGRALPVYILKFGDTFHDPNFAKEWNHFWILRVIYIIWHSIKGFSYYHGLAYQVDDWVDDDCIYG